MLPARTRRELCPNGKPSSSVAIRLIASTWRSALNRFRPGARAGQQPQHCSGRWALGCSVAEKPLNRKYHSPPPLRGEVTRILKRCWVWDSSAANPSRRIRAVPNEQLLQIVEHQQRCTPAKERAQHVDGCAAPRARQATHGQRVWLNSAGSCTSSVRRRTLRLEMHPASAWRGASANRVLPAPRIHAASRAAMRVRKGGKRREFLVASDQRRDAIQPRRQCASRSH